MLISVPLLHGQRAHALHTTSSKQVELYGAISQLHQVSGCRGCVIDFEESRSCGKKVSYHHFFLNVGANPNG